VYSQPLNSLLQTLKPFGYPEIEIVKSFHNEVHNFHRDDFISPRKCCVFRDNHVWHGFYMYTGRDVICRRNKDGGWIRKGDNTMRTSIALTLAMLALLSAGAFAQDPNTTTTMTCMTSDGLVTISASLITLADYQLQFDSFVNDGITRYTDEKHNTVAVLDARDDQGLYLEIQENGILMQVVAARADVRYRYDGNEPAAPTWSSVVPRTETLMTSNNIDQ
jgi:hypothetical protein